MRILFTIAHYYRQQDNGFYGSLATPPRRRFNVLMNCLAALHQSFGPRQGLMFTTERRIAGANDLYRGDIEVVICTQGEDHLLARVPKPLYSRRDVAGDPMLLGYACHEVMRERIDDFDFFCYLEDDIVVADPEFFRKLEWFESLAGPDCVLQANRYESRVDQPVQKLYIDGNLRDPTVSRQFQDITDGDDLHGEHLGRKICFQRVDNSHAGCFFLSQAQMRKWIEQPYFLERTDAFCGPLESAATLGVMKTFKVYKASRENAGFFEVRHGDNRYLGHRIKVPSNWKP